MYEWDKLDDNSKLDGEEEPLTAFEQELHDAGYSTLQETDGWLEGVVYAGGLSDAETVTEEGQTRLVNPQQHLPDELTEIINNHNAEIEILSFGDTCVQLGLTVAVEEE